MTTLDSFYLKHFEREKAEAATFWRRIGGRPALDGSRVLDFGSGLGALCVDIAEHGAARVVGVDIQQCYVDFARANVAVNHCRLSGVIDFQCLDIGALPDSDFDFIVSKDVFEHVQGDGAPEAILEQLKRRLKPTGKLLLGFGPLWYSPFGDHDLSKNLVPFAAFPVPWGHLLVSESFFLRKLNARLNENYRSIYECGLNKLPYGYYDKMIRSSGMNVVSYRVNVTDSPLRGIVAMLRKVPFLTNLLTSTIYCVLEHDGGPPASGS